MEPQVHSSSSSSSPPSSPCYSSSLSSPSSSYVDGARLVPFPFLSPNRNESQLAGNPVPTVAGIAIEQLRFIGRMAHGGTEWKNVEERFDRLASTTAGPVPVVNRSDFAFCIGMEDTPEFAEELLEALQGRSGNGDNRITKAQLHEHWQRLTDPTFNSRIRIFFDLCDKNKDGKITEMEIKQVILLSASTNKLLMTQEEAEDYSTLIMEELDTSQRGFIVLSQLERLFFSESQLVISSQSNPEDHNQENHRRITRTPSIEEVYLRTYWRRSWIVGLWLIICLTLFTWKFIQYSHREAFLCMGYCLSTAKGAAETLKFNMALILLPVCRNTVTWLRRNRRINSVIPFNDNINFHKLIAGGIVVGVILHAGSHLTCDLPRIASCNHLVFRRTIAGGFGNHQPSYVEILGTTEALTGVAMVVLMAIAFTLATPLSRQRSPSLPWPLRRVTGFNMFWYSHHLFIIVYALLIVHSIYLFLTQDVREKTVFQTYSDPNTFMEVIKPARSLNFKTWVYIAFPVLLYLWERIFRAIRSGLYHVEVLEAKTYSGKVLSLKLSKPEDFNYRSGMYIFIQCPQISPFEWHPFSLTSAPEDNYLNVHIRTQGDWSYQMYSLFQEALAPVGSGFPKIYIDGPYGAASQDHVKYDVVILIGLGIGATPFISILKDVVHGLHKPNMDYGDGGVESGIINTKGPSKAYLYWVTREQSSFDWFRDVIKEVSHGNRKQDVVEIHNFLTSVYEDGDARSALISAIQALYHAKKGIDIVSGTAVRTRFSRPNWSKVFSNLASKHEGARIGVFYCGHSALARELERLCTNLTTKTTTRFVFHKENY